MQSKARNEVLSLITAFQNPVDFTDRLYFYYAFVYLFITLMTIVPFGICLFYGRTLIRRLKHKKKLFILGNLFWVLLTASISFSMWQGASLLSYYLFYASKSSSFWEILIKYIFDSKELQWSTSFDLSLFQKEVFISLQSGNMVAVFLIFIYTVYRQTNKEKELYQKNIFKSAITQLGMVIYTNSKFEIIKVDLLILHYKLKKILYHIVYGVLLYVFLFASITLFVSHTAYQLGSFGKNLAQFDTDLVIVDFNLNGQIQKVEGVRVYQDKNYIVIRDSQNNMHNIFTDQIHIQTKQLESK